MPCFELLFPGGYNSIVMDLLWELAWFHALAHLRAHSDGTLITFEAAVITLGAAVRRFVTKVCSNLSSRELPKETLSRKRRKQAKKQSTSATAKQKVLNLNTYKYHRLGDYPQAVREFGPLDGYSTQTVCPISPIMASS